MNDPTADTFIDSVGLAGAMAVLGGMTVERVVVSLLTAAFVFAERMGMDRAAVVGVFALVLKLETEQAVTRKAGAS